MKKVDGRVAVCSVHCADHYSIEDSVNRQAEIQCRARSTSKIVASRSTEYIRMNFPIDCHKQKGGERKVVGTSHEFRPWSSQLSYSGSHHADASTIDGYYDEYGKVGSCAAPDLDKSYR